MDTTASAAPIIDPADVIVNPDNVNGPPDGIYKLQEVTERLQDLISLHHSATYAREDYADAIKAVAKKAGLKPAVLRKFVSASASAKFAAHKKQAEQLSLIFEFVGG